jgi:hypothetical protein
MAEPGIAGADDRQRRKGPLDLGGQPEPAGDSDQGVLIGELLPDKRFVAGSAEVRLIGWDPEGDGQDGEIYLLEPLDQPERFSEVGLVRVFLAHPKAVGEGYGIVKAQPAGHEYSADLLLDLLGCLDEEAGAIFEACPIPAVGPREDARSSRQDSRGRL